jgi:hypothetical protein
MLATWHVVSAADYAVGLYYPDFKAMRSLIDPKGVPTVPDGYRREEIREAWDSLTQQGRDLMLREKDLVMAVIDQEGNWFFRTSGVYTLRSLEVVATDSTKNDLSHLRIILDNPWFDSLRDFYGRILFARASSPKDLVKVVQSVDNLAEAEAEQKQWFRSIVGSEIAKMDNMDRRALLFDDTYGPEFVDAVAIAEAHREQRLHRIEKALEAVEVMEDRISASDVVLAAPFSGDWEVPQEYVNIISLQGQKAFEISSDGGTVYILAKDGAASRFIPRAVEQGWLPDLIDRGEYSAFMGTPGTSKVYQVKPDPA